ncbi:hypothetical protein ABZ766_11645 [Streptomyces sp. NPDC006670]|uniref:hypothetical protein n=1 Tax=Streptomyces sp. NPDC006670 TaxID=3154476 RepID=UPI0033FD39DC
MSKSYVNGPTSSTATVDATGKHLSFTTNSPDFTVYVKGTAAYDTSGSLSA